MVKTTKHDESGKKPTKPAAKRIEYKNQGKPGRIPNSAKEKRLTLEEITK
jgi:hypothetical protein